MSKQQTPSSEVSSKARGKRTAQKKDERIKFAQHQKKSVPSEATAAVKWPGLTFQCCH